MEGEERNGGALAGRGSGELWRPPAGARAKDEYIRQAIHSADVNESRPDQPFVTAYDEIKNVLWIKSNPVYQVALEEWDRKAQYLSTVVARMQKNSSELTRDIYELIGFYSVFIGLTLTTVPQLAFDPQASQKIWSPISLTVLALVMTVGGILYKSKRLNALEVFHPK